MPEEEKDVATASSAEEEGQKETGEPEGGEKKEQSVPFSRFKEVNDKLKQANQILDWLHRNFESPGEIVELLKLKKERSEAATRSNGEEKLTEEQKVAVRKLIRESDPALAKVLSRAEKTSDEDDEEAREDDLVDDTEAELLEIVKEKKLPKDEKFLSRLGKALMLEITTDPKLYRKWQRGDMRVVRQAFNSLEEEFLSPLRPAGKSDLQTKRSIARLPTLPEGGSTISGKPQQKKEPQGITRDVHNTAYEILKELSRE